MEQREDTFSKTADAGAERLMRAEADAFLAAMPAGLQHRQAEAVLSAMAGDATALTAVRHSRNTPPLCPANVESRMIAANMRIYEPRGCAHRRLPALLYLHGGGWTFGSINSCGRFCGAVAASGRVRVVALDYRLAPEHPFPDGLNDCIAALNHITGHAGDLMIDASRITVGGDSSGGNLALATALSQQCRGKVESLLLFYPVTKAKADGSESWRRYGCGYGLDAELMEAFNRAYTQRAKPASTAVSPGLCDGHELQQLPRTLIVAAERDILRDQGAELAQRMGSRARRVEYGGAVHLFITVPGQDTAFHRAVTDALAFID